MTGTDAAGGLKTVHDEFLRVAGSVPDDPAVLFENGGKLRAMTYRQLADYSGRLAGMLARAGVGPGACVALLPERGFDPVAMMLGVARAGAAFTFPGSAIPPERLRFILHDLSAAVVLCHSRLAETVPAGFKVIPVDKVDWRKEQTITVPSPIGPDDPFAICYTSGTTGVPRGVVLNHGNLLEFCRMDAVVESLDRTTRSLAQADLSFDAFMWNTLPTLLAGGRVFMVSADCRRSLHETHEFMLRHRVTHVFFTTRLAEEYIREYANPHLRYFAMGGEKMRPVALPTYPLYNHYGPTECTIYVTAHRVDGTEGEIPIGPPLGRNRIVVMDKAGNACRDGDEGEICVSGPQVSPGYHNQPERTAEKFIANPVFDAQTDPACYARMYRTGDFGVCSANGEILYRGRMDRQVKIRGYRIEPEEVEIALLRHPVVDQAVVTTWEGGDGRPTLVAYFVPRGAPAANVLDVLRDHMERLVPPYMMPSFFVPIDRIPLRPSGKVDAASLPPPR